MNFYLDNPEMKFYLSHPLLKHIVELKERNYADFGKYDYAPENFEDAMDSYERIISLAGDICANVIAPNAEAVDAEGPHVENNRMIYASKTYDNLKACRQAGLHGVLMPRRYGGLNFPQFVYAPINEMMSTADTGLRISGLCRIVSLPSTNSATRSSARSIFLLYVTVQQCLWTLPSLMPVLTCRVSC